LSAAWAAALLEGETFFWFWIGSHDEIREAAWSIVRLEETAVPGTVLRPSERLAIVRAVYGPFREAVIGPTFTSGEKDAHTRLFFPCPPPKAAGTEKARGG
jgi:hypothetical protein